MDFGNILSGLSSMFGSGSGGSGAMFMISEYANNASTSVNAQHMLNSTNIKVEEMQLAMACESEKSEWNKWKLIEDTQNKIYEIQQDVIQNQTKTQDKVFGKWDDIVKS